MSLRKKIVALGTTGLAVAGLSLAAAATPLAPAPSASAATAPNCITTVAKSGFYDSVTVTNGCSSTYRVKAIFANGPDGTCTTLRAGYQYTSTTGAAGRFDRLDLC